MKIKIKKRIKRAVMTIKTMMRRRNVIVQLL